MPDIQEQAGEKGQAIASRLNNIAKLVGKYVEEHPEAVGAALGGTAAGVGTKLLTGDNKQALLAAGLGVGGGALLGNAIGRETPGEVAAIMEDAGLTDHNMLYKHPYLAAAAAAPAALGTVYGGRKASALFHKKKRKTPLPLQEAKLSEALKGNPDHVERVAERTAELGKQGFDRLRSVLLRLVTRAP